MFTSDASAILKNLFDNLLRLFQITIPGTNVSFIGLGLGMLATIFVISIFKNVLSMVTGIASVTELLGGGKSNFGSDSTTKFENKKVK